ncbi:UbiA prenyltransferase family-domain-containing protein [Pestalotiopsis sp. NC0098]|nr:UbiA prenyltransferase family-domain-containing protein [Pestalotiopsis sp. NC0098]
MDSRLLAEPFKHTSSKASDRPKSRLSLSGLPGRIAFIWNIFWLLTKDDFATFVLPNTAFGIFGALSGSAFVSPASGSFQVVLRLPMVILFNWSNLLIFDLANQRLPSSFAEDALNKPWRPGPSGLVGPTQLRQAMLFCIPAVIALHYTVLGTGSEATALAVLTWLYNDLCGGDEHWVLRNVIIAAAFGLYNAGSLKVAAGLQPGQTGDLTEQGHIWVLAISAVILTTMHVQDLKDQEGDRARGRRSAPLVLGDRACRWTIALPVLFWSLFLPWCLRCSVLGVAFGTIFLGLWVAFRCMAYSGNKADRRTWELWALWTASLYALPWLVYIVRD